MDAESVARQNEELYVHSVYERIADHFSRTRYKVLYPLPSFAGIQSNSNDSLATVTSLPSAFRPM